MSKECKTCGGSGQVGEEIIYQGRSMGFKECPACKGTGQEPTDDRALKIIAKVAKAQIEEKYGSVANAITEECSTGQEPDDAAEFVEKGRGTLKYTTGVGFMIETARFKKALDLIAQLQEQLAEKDKDIAANRWIPVGERLPEKTDNYLTLIKYPNTINPTPVVDMYLALEGAWASNHEHVFWKPIILPEQALQDGKEKE